MGSKRKAKKLAPALSATALSEALGVSRQTVYNYKAQGCPHTAAGFELDQVRAWRVARGDKRKERKPEALQEREVLRLTSAEDTSLEYRRVKTAQERIKLEKLREEVLPRADVEDLFVRRAVEFKHGLQELVNRLPPRLGPADERECGEILKAAVRSLLDRYSRPLNLDEGNGRAAK